MSSSIYTAPLFLLIPSLVISRNVILVMFPKTLNNEYLIFSHKAHPLRINMFCCDIFKRWYVFYDFIQSVDLDALFNYKSHAILSEILVIYVIKFSKNAEKFTML